MSGALMDQLEKSAVELEQVTNKLKQCEEELEVYKKQEESRIEDESPDPHELEDLRAKLENANMEIEMLKSSAQTLNILRENLESAQAEASDLQQKQLEDLEQSKNLDSNFALGEAQFEIESLRNLLEEQEQKASMIQNGLQADLDEAKKEIVSLSAKLIQSPQGDGVDSGLVDELNIKLGEAQLANMKMNQKLKALQHQIASNDSSLELEEARQEIDELKSKLAELQKDSVAVSEPESVNEVESLRKKLEESEMQLEIAKTSEEVADRLREELRIKNQEAEKLVEELSASKGGREKLAEELSASNEAREKLVAELSASNEAREKLEAEVKNEFAQQSLMKAEQELVEANDKVKSLLQQIQELQKSPPPTDVNLELEEALQEVAELKQKLEESAKNAAESPPKQSLDEIADLRQKLEEAEMQLEISKTAEDVADCLRKELADANSEKEMLIAQRSTDNSKLVQTQVELMEAKSEIDALNAELRDIMQTPPPKDLTLDLEEANKEVNNLKSQLADLMQNPSPKDLTLELEQANQEVSRLKSQLAVYEEAPLAPAESSGEIEALRQKLEDTEMQLELSKTAEDVANCLREELKKKEKDIQALEDQIKQDTSREELADAKAEIKALMREMQEMRSESAPAELSSQLEATQREVLELREKLKDFRKDPAAALLPADSSKEADMLREKIGELEHELQMSRTAEDVADCLREELKQYQVEMQNLRDQLSEARSNEELIHVKERNIQIE